MNTEQISLRDVQSKFTTDFKENTEINNLKLPGYLYVKPKLLSLEELNYNNILSICLEIYANQTPTYTKLSYSENIEGLLNVFKEYDILHEHTYFKYADSEMRYISFRRTKINKNDLMNFIKLHPIMFSKSNINNIIYNRLLQDLKLNHSTTESIYNKVFI
jgi:hypothetical protein